MADIDKKAIKSIQDDNIKPRWRKQFPVIGKGTFLFNIARNNPFYITVRDNPTDDLKLDSWIGLTVTKERVSFLNKVLDEDPETLREETSSELFGSNIGIEPDYTCTYWLSYDRDRMVIKYGKGYRMKKTTILEYNFDHLESDRKELIRKEFFDPKVDRYVELYDEQPWETPVTEVSKSKPTAGMTAIDDVEKEVDFEPMPMVTDLSYIVKGSSTVNLFDLDSGKYIYSASLPPECQVLYDNITAKNVDLDYQGTDADHQYGFNLSDAIRYSIETEGCTLNERLKAKVGEFGDSDPLETYLRITLGKEKGNAPGIPYVLELWPKNHRSPIHNHGNAYALIRVLHGGLDVHYYNKASVKVLLSDESADCGCDGESPAKELGVFHVTEGDVTWISPNWYQTHMLSNNTNDYCATVQCYLYGNNDYMNWPYFDYIKSCDIIGEFTSLAAIGLKYASWRQSC